MRDAWEPTGASNWNGASPLRHPSGRTIACAFNIGLGNLRPQSNLPLMAFGPGLPGDTEEDEGETGICGGRWRKNVDVEGRSETGAIESGNFVGDARVAWAAGRVL